MAVDLCSSTSPAGSPRLSFSRDSPPQLHQQDPPSPDFNFCIPSFADSYPTPTPADELFSNGKLKLIHQNGFSPNPASLPPLPQRKERLKEIIACPEDEAEKERISNPVKPSSFWRFGRSTSLNCGGGGTKLGGLTCSLQLLPRSKSAGSDSCPAPKQQRRSGSGTTTNPKCLRKSSSTSKASPFVVPQQAPSSYYYGTSDKGGTGVRISPVLNVPPPFSVKGAGGNGFFGLGHLFCSGKEKGGNSSAKKKALFFASS